MNNLTLAELTAAAQAGTTPELVAELSRRVDRVKGWCWSTAVLCTPQGTYRCKCGKKMDTPEEVAKHNRSRELRNMDTPITGLVVGVVQNTPME